MQFANVINLCKQSKVECVAQMYSPKIMVDKLKVFMQACTEDLFNLRERAVDNRIDLTSLITAGGWFAVVELYYPESSKLPLPLILLS